MGRGPLSLPGGEGVGSARDRLQRGGTAARALGGGCCRPTAQALPASPHPVCMHFSGLPPSETPLHSRLLSPLAVPIPAGCQGAPRRCLTRGSPWIHGPELWTTGFHVRSSLSLSEFITLGCLFPSVYAQNPFNINSEYMDMCDLTSNFYLEAHNRRRMQAAFCLLGVGGPRPPLYPALLATLLLPPRQGDPLFSRSRSVEVAFSSLPLSLSPPLPLSLSLSQQRLHNSLQVSPS